MTISSRHSWDMDLENNDFEKEEEGPNYFLMGGPNPAYCRKRSKELQPATLHLLLS